MMIDEALAELIPALPKDRHELLSADFELVLEGQAYKKATVILLTDCLILRIEKSQENFLLKVSLTFDLIFTLLRVGDEVVGEPHGLKFERFEKEFTLHNVNMGKSLLEWRNKLQKMINQRGFHELYKPIKKVGKGNFASVYLVTKHEDGKNYAVKAFSKEGTFSEEKGKESLINEIQVMRKFDHKNLMKIYGVYESQNSIYISVQLLEGGQLYDKIKNKHKFTPAEIKLIMKGILEGLQVMHQKNIMHRDLKPENILLRKENDFDCVIADFGLAEDYRNQDYLFVRCGTPGYVAPEVVNLKDMKAKYEPICDMFSVGVIFHLLALRKSPFPGREYDEVLAQNRACKFNFEAHEYSQLSDSWLDLLKRLLEKNPKKRITATQALNHEFFSKDTMFAQFNNIRSSSIQTKESQLKEEEDRRLSIECQSPLMMTRNNARKNQGKLRDDSCLKFKMKENVMTGRTDQNEDSAEEIESPAVVKKKGVKTGESRFKKMVHKE